jgi:hypothetical protein
VIDWELIGEVRYKKDIFIGKLNVSDCYRRKHQPIIDRINYHSAMDAMYNDEIAHAEEDGEFMEDLFSTLNENQVEFIKFEISESEGGYGFKIISDKPSWKPEWEKGYDKPLMNVWVDQSSGYPCEDCYSGFVYVELIENEKYIQWSFSM